MYTKTIYLSGGSFYELEAVFSKIKGTEKVTTGYITAGKEVTSHEAVLRGDFPAILGIKVEYDPKKIDLSSILDVLFTVVNPYLENQAEDLKGPMYQSGVWYNSGEDEPIIDYYMNFIRNRQKTPAATEAGLTMNDPNSDKVNLRRLFAKAGRLINFSPAADEHQNFLSKHPETKTHIDFVMLKELGIIE